MSHNIQQARLTMKLDNGRTVNLTLTDTQIDIVTTMLGISFPSKKTICSYADTSLNKLYDMECNPLHMIPLK